MTQRINIAEDFSPVPIGRSKEYSNSSGEVFRTEILRPKMEQAIRNNEILEIDFDGMLGFNASFLEEAFGGLVRKDEDNPAPLAVEDVLDTLQFLQAHDHLYRFYIENIKQYIRQANSKKIER